MEPVKYQYRSVQDMFEYMAECEECEMLLVLNKGVCVTTKMKVYDMDLSMLDLPWTETGILPLGAVENQNLTQQVFDIYEGILLFKLLVLTTSGSACCLWLRRWIELWRK